MLVVQCKECRKELTSNSGQSKSCGCPNMMTVKGDSVTAVDLTRVVMVRSNKENVQSNALSPQDLAYQEERRKRKVRKLDFEIR
jgi:hypothetical protein